MNHKMKTALSFLCMAVLCGCQAQQTPAAQDEPEPQNTESGEVSENTEEPETVQKVTWNLAPSMKLDGIRDLEFEPYILLDVQKEMRGYAPEWAKNVYLETGNEFPFGSYTCDAIEVTVNGRKGIYDYSGNVIYPAVIEENIGSFANYYNYIEDASVGSMNVFAPDFRSTEEMPASGLGGAVVSLRQVIDNEIYLLDFATSELSPVAYNEDSACLMYEYSSQGEKIGMKMVSKDGKIFDIEGDEYRKIINGWLPVSESGMWTFQSASNGTILSGYIYDDVKYFENGYAPVKKNGKWGFVDESGTEVTDFIFDDASTLYEGKTYVSFHGSYGILDLKTTLAQSIPVNEETCTGDAVTPKDSEGQPIGIVKVNVDGLNVRKEPSAEAEKAAESGSVLKGQTFTVTSVKEAEGYTWYEIGENMWIASDGSWVTYKE